MLTKSDFQDRINTLAQQNDTLAPLFNVQDPRLTQHIDAMATMLSMFSAQIEVAIGESFERVRDATVLADAAMRGVIVKSKPAQVQINVKNNYNGVINLVSGSILLDSSNNEWIVSAGKTISENNSDVITAVQKRVKTLDVITITESKPFYKIQVPVDDNGDYLSELSLTVNNVEFSYRERYTNIAPNQQVFNVEMDEKKNLYIVFGYENVAGYQVKANDEILITVSYSTGEILIPNGSTFTLKEITQLKMSSLEFVISKIDDKGTNPPSVDVLRYLCKYPAIYDSSAVFLGEFDFLIRRRFPAIKFLSVWNEQIEENKRGGSYQNINKLFIACSFGNEQLSTSSTSSIEIVSNLTANQIAIRDLVNTADSGYYVQFVAPKKNIITYFINAKIPAQFDITAIENSILAIVNTEFGIDSDFAKKGGVIPTTNQIRSVIIKKIPAFSRDINSDLSIQKNNIGQIYPEFWNYVFLTSANITVESIDIDNQNTGFN